MANNPTQTQYEHVQEILSNAAQGAHPDHDGHGRFWELPLDQFLLLNIYGVQLIADPGDNRSARSGLIQAITGAKPFDGSVFDRMPLGRPPVAPEDIQFIAGWIDAGCSNDPFVPPAKPVLALATAAALAGAAPAAPPALRASNAQRAIAGSLQHRKNIVDLLPSELDNLRQAFQALQNLPPGDNRSYGKQAAIHGDWCAHGTQSFLTWHRAYLYQFELLLQEQVPGVTLPYWDWTTTREIPAAYSDTSWGSASNPLYNNTRDPGSGDALPTPDEVNTIQADTTFTAYGGGQFRAGDLEAQPHNFVHVWVGGDMAQVPQAAFDPLFWAHHANIDRLWAAWQVTNPGAAPTNPTYVLQPFNMKVQDTYSTEVLGYDYAAADTLFLTDNTQSLAQISTGPTRLPLPVLQRDFSKAELQLHNVQHPKESFEVRVYLDHGAAPTYANGECAKRFALFGHGQCRGGAGHCDVPTEARSKFDLREPHRKTPFDIALDVTEAVKDAVQSGAGDIAVTLVAFDNKGNQVPDGVLNLDGLSIVIKD